MLKTFQLSKLSRLSDDDEMGFEVKEFFEG